LLAQDARFVHLTLKVVPEILASLFFGWIMSHILHNNRIAAVISGGFFMLIAAGLLERVVDSRAETIAKTEESFELQKQNE